MQLGEWPRTYIPTTVLHTSDAEAESVSRGSRFRIRGWGKRMSRPVLYVSASSITSPLCGLSMRFMVG